MADDPWPGDTYRLISREYAHALGMLVIAYNNAEHAIFLLVDILLKNNRAARQTINHHLHNSARLDLLKQLAAELPSGERECVLHAVQCFDVCTENRNILMHATLQPSPEPIDDLVAHKRHSSKPGAEIKIELPLSRLREIAEDTVLLHSFATLLWVHFVQERAIPSLRERYPGADLTGLRLEMPPKPHLPSKLSLPRSLSDPDSGKLPPLPSWP